MKIDSKILNSIRCLDSWVEHNGWAGYDPYDIKGIPFFLYPQPALPLKAVQRLGFMLESQYPILLRRIFRVQKQINAKAMGLFARGYLNMYQSTGEEMFRKKSIFCLDWLEKNASKGYNGSCWGYPFDWQSKVFIPAGTPSSVVSSVAGDGFWTAYQVLGDLKYLEICKKICNFFIQDLNIDRINRDSVCFSYTPIDDFHVHNANLFVAEFLTRVGYEIGEQDYMDLGSQAASYALSEQNANGSLYYWGQVQNYYNPYHIDHYHTGFEIRSLYGLWKCTGEQKYRQAVEKYYKFYRDNLLTQLNGNAVPKITPNSIYPVNIHSCAEAILCNATLAEEFEDARAILHPLCEWVIDKMQTKEGWFIYMIRQTRIGLKRIEIPYIRWGQAWMLLALASLVKVHLYDTTD